jgi:hypothetical protein
MNFNPYNNPLPYSTPKNGSYYIQGNQENQENTKANFLKQLYQGIEEYPEGLFFNTIPDPTLVARPGFTGVDINRPRLISGETNCSYRFCK